MNKKKIIFLTATRADFGKLKPLIGKIENLKFFKCYIFATGMHTLSKYGNTIEEIKKERYKNIYSYINQNDTDKMDIILSNTILGFSHYISELCPDMIVVHGDRIEALAGAIVGSLNNILVSHIEGGELSGTIDETMRHAITKLSHIHFVANSIAKKRLVQLGENKNHIFVIGSPDIDIMLSNKLPTLDFAKKRYDINFNSYASFIYHPVTTELNKIENNITNTVNALIKSNKKYIVLFPNNDMGSNTILKEYKRFEDNPNFKMFPSMRFEYFLTLLKNSSFIIGNSSAGIREAPIYGVPTINLGTRQQGRTTNKQIININEKEDLIIKTIENIGNKKIKPVKEFGEGNSCDKFYKILLNKEVWNISPQKMFIDIDEI
jgi:UDP-N-acetylglucosamine 2-epimerase (hydrolysing)